MSVESFFAAYPADENFVPNISRRSEYGRVSPVRLLADIFIKEGHFGLEEIGQIAAAAVRTDDKDEIKRLTPAYFSNTSSVFFGATARAIEGILKDQEFDQITYCSLMTEAFRGTNWSPPQLIENPVVEPISVNDCSRIAKVATRDRTFADFFSVGIYSLPISLQDYLEKANQLPYIRRFIIPEYVLQARLLIAERYRSKSL